MDKIIFINEGPRKFIFHVPILKKYIHTYTHMNTAQRNLKESKKKTKGILEIIKFT